MQTFLPFEEFEDSASVLDWRRLGKQRSEGKQILQALTTHPNSKWRNHPAVLMWRGHEQWLWIYIMTMCDEWHRRGYRNTDKMNLAVPEIGTERPPWLGDPALHASHRSNLLRKNSEWYGQFGWTEPNDLPYVWPVRKDDALGNLGPDRKKKRR